MSREWVTVPVERPEIVSDFLRGGLGGVRVANADIVAIGAYIERLEALAAAPQPAQAPEWQPIETAKPQDKVLLYSPAKNMSNRPGQKPDWRVDRPAAFTWATHWQPLPAPPKEGV